MPSSRGLLGIISLFGFRGLASTPITKSDTDAGVGVDGAEVAAQAISDTDSGAGVDGSEVSTATIPNTDTGIGADGEELISATVPDTDAGVGVDIEVPAGGYQVEVPSADLGIVVETESLAVTLSDTDSGVGIDTETLATDRELEICITSITGDLTIIVSVTSEDCE